MNAQFAVEVGGVRLDGVLAEEQLLGYGVLRKITVHESQDRPLRRARRLQLMFASLLRRPQAVLDVSSEHGQIPGVGESGELFVSETEL